MKTQKYLKNLIKLGIKHTIKSCSSSITVKIENGESYFFPHCGEKIDPKYLSFIKSVKNEVIFNAQSKGEKLNLKKPKYIKFSPNFSENFYHEKCEFFEIDINGAYWFSAKDLGFISDETYLKGLEVPKKVRLMALGAAASIKDVIVFDGENYKFSGIEFNEYGRAAFFEIAYKIDSLMFDAMDLIKGNCAFFWVDAIFVKSKYVEFIENYFNGMGFEVKKIPLAWIKGTVNPNTIETMKIISENENVCDFERKIYFKPKKSEKIKEKKRKKTPKFAV